MFSGLRAQIIPEGLINNIPWMPTLNWLVMYAKIQRQCHKATLVVTILPIFSHYVIDIVKFPTFDSCFPRHSVVLFNRKELYPH